jgi:hypothetical protein
MNDTNKVIMDDNKKSKRSWLINLIILVAFFGIFAGVLAFYSYKMIESSKKKLIEINAKAEAYNFKTETGKPNLYENPDLFKIYKEKIYKESLIEQSKQDSMGLVVNLQDSSLTILISGIPVFSTKAKSFNISGIYRNLSPKAYLYYFRKPFVVDSCNATFEKEPITRKEAPKDTLEAASFFAKPDTTLNFRVMSNYYLGYGFKLTIEQTLTDSIEDRKYIINNKLNYFWDSFKKVMTLKNLEYEPKMIIYVTATDAMVIYRALPQKANIVILPY